MIEWKRAGEEGIDDAAKAPDVARECVGLFEEDLRSHVAQCAKGLLCRIAWPNDLRQAKIDDLWDRGVRAVAHHDVFQFEVAMHNAELVQVLHTKGGLVGQVLGALLGH